MPSMRMVGWTLLLSSMRSTAISHISLAGTFEALRLMEKLECIIATRVVSGPSTWQAIEVQQVLPITEAILGSSCFSAARDAIAVGPHGRSVHAL